MWGGVKTSEWSSRRSLEFCNTNHFLVRGQWSKQWRVVETDALNRPPLTKDASATVVGDIVYIFGGRTIPNEVQSNQPTSNLTTDVNCDTTYVYSNYLYACKLSKDIKPTWKKLDVKDGFFLPNAVANCSMVGYEEKLYIFGGYGNGYPGISRWEYYTLLSLYISF